VNAEIITTGTEILLGEIIDTNAAWIARQLREAGVNLYYKTTVGDNEARLREVIELALSRSDVVIVTGGLGPTVDDVTRTAIAAATGRPLELREDALQTLQARFARFGVQMTDNNRRQAYIPRGGVLIENPVGTAPGILVEDERGAVFALPGVPREMKRMMEDGVLPWLRVYNGDQGIIRRRVLRTVGIGESAVDSKLGELMHSANPSVGLAAHPGQVDVRITASAPDEAAVEAALDAMEARVRAVIGEYVYSATPRESFPAVAARLLTERQIAVAILETNTGGVIARALAAALPDDVPAGLVTGSTSADLPSPLAEEVVAAAGGGYSEALALRVAEQIAAEAEADYGLAILGSAGEDQGIYADLPGETYLALVGPGLAKARRLAFGGRDQLTQLLTGNRALLLLWRALRD
jgi:nicotinamide-nucleotide amidase